MDAFWNTLTACFIAVLNMSLRGAWMILAVAALRLVLRRAPRPAVCALWGVVGFRLVCPVSFAASFSLLPAANPVPQNMEQMAQPAIQSGVPVVDGLVNPLLPAAGPAASGNPLQTLLPLAALAWLAGMALLLGGALLNLARLRRRLRGASPLPWPAELLPPPAQTPPLRVCAGLPTAFVLGLVRPVICLPDGLQGRQLACILCHECAHLRRLDHLAKPLAFLLLCLHWFNPLAWLAFLLLGRDMELACDEAALRRLGPGQKKNYCDALLALASPHPLRAAPLAFGECAVAARIKNVLRYRKAKVWVSAAALALLAVLALALLADPPGGTAGALQVTFPAYQEGRNEYNAAIYDTAPFTVSLPLPGGWQLAPGDGGGSPWTPMWLLDADGQPVGSIGFGCFEDIPDLPAEELYKAAYAELRLGSLISWCADYTPVRTTDTQEAARSICLVNNVYLRVQADNGSGVLILPADGASPNQNAADAGVQELPCVTLYDRTLGVYAALWLLPDALTDAQLTALAEGITLETATD